MSMSRTIFPALLFLALAPSARADLVYDVSAAGSSDFIPMEEDGTPNRPYGSHLGNEITFDGTARYLTHAQAVLSRSGPVDVANYTIDLYQVDGTVDPSSGLTRPGTLLGSYTTAASNGFIPGTAAFVVDWDFAPILVPDTIIAVLSSNYDALAPGSLVGAYAALTPPVTGSALNTIWYGDGSPGSWTANSTWAIDDGGATNYMDMRFTAVRSVPEPGGVMSLAIGAVLAGGLRRRWRA